MATIDWSWEQVADTAAVLYAANLKLNLGQVGFETDTFKFKVGDGVTLWNDMQYGVINNGQSVWVGLSSTAGNMLTRSTDGGFYMNPNQFFSKLEFAEAIGSTSGPEDMDGVAVKAAPWRAAVMLRKVIEALGPDYVNLKTGDVIDETLQSKIQAVAASSVTLASLLKDTITATNSTWSSTKIDSFVNLLVNQKIAALVGDAPEVLDTIYKLAAALGENQNLVTTIAADLANTVRFNVAQNLNDTQKAQARTNIGAASAAFVGSDADTTPDDSFITAINEGRLSAAAFPHVTILPAVA